MNTRQQARRKYPRAEVDWPVDVETSKDTLKGCIKNISRGGALIYLSKKLDTHDHIRLGIEIPEYEDVIFAKGEVLRSFTVYNDHNADIFCIGIKFTEISNEDLRYFTGNLAEEWRKDYQEPIAHQNKNSYFKLIAYSITIFVFLSTTTYALKFRGSEQPGEQILELNSRIVALEEQLSASRSIEADIANLENHLHEVDDQLVSIQEKSNSFVTIDNLLIQTKYFKDEIVELKNSIKPSLLPENKIPTDNEENSDFVYHVVANGDNLYRISLMYNIHIDKIKELNKISNNDSIYLGQKLIVGWK